MFKSDSMPDIIMKTMPGTSSDSFGHVHEIFDDEFISDDQESVDVISKLHLVCRN